MSRSGKTTGMFKEIIKVICDQHLNPVDRRTNIIIVSISHHHSIGLQKRFMNYIDQNISELQLLMIKTNRLHISLSGFSIKFMSSRIPLKNEEFLDEVYRQESFYKSILGCGDFLVFEDEV